MEKVEGLPIKVMDFPSIETGRRRKRIIVEWGMLVASFGGEKNAVTAVQLHAKDVKRFFGRKEYDEAAVQAGLRIG